MGGYDGRPRRWLRTTSPSRTRAGEYGWRLLRRPASHIAAIAQALKGKPRLPSCWSRTCGCRLDNLVTKEKLRFVNIGERCNIAGSIAFKLVLAGDYQKCMEVAAKQVAGGMFGINLDDGLLDGVGTLQVLQDCRDRPDVSSPFMIDSSKFQIMEAGLQCVQGAAL